MFRLTRNFRRAFTLVEMLVVISIIIVMISISVPVVKTLTGNSSLAGAENKVQAMLAVARSDAIYNRQITGVLFFIDPQTNDFAMAEVMPNQMYASNPTGGAANALVPQTVPYNTAAPAGVPSLELVYSWQPSTVAGQTYMNKYYYRDIVPLPPGVGVALCNNVYTTNTGTPITNVLPNEFQDRYMHFGAIMFNTDGTLIQMPYGIAGICPNTPVAYNPASSPPARLDFASGYPNINQLTARLQLQADLTTIFSPWPNPAITIPLPLTSATGLIFYDRVAFQSQHDPTPGLTSDSFIDSDASAGSNLNNTHADLEIWTNAVYGSGLYPTMPTPAQQQIKYDEESWLDQNGTTAIVSPLNGNLVKSK